MSWIYMDTQIQKLSLFAILPLVLTAFSLGFLAEADAAKAEGSPGTVSPKSYDSENNDIVCGDKLCSEKENNISNLNT